MPTATMPATISRKPTSLPHEAICRGLGRIIDSSVARISFFCMTLFLSFFLPFALLFGDFIQLGQRLFAPALMRLQLQLTEARRHLPIGRVGILLVLADLLQLNALELAKKGALAFHHALHMLNRN